MSKEDADQKPPKPLTRQESIFCDALLLGQNKRQAALTAGCSKASAHRAAWRFLQREHVKEYLASFYRREAEETQIAREILREKLFAMATCDPGDAYNDDFSPRNKSDMPEAVRALIVSARTWDTPEQGSGSSIKLAPQEQIIRTYLKLFPPPPEETDRSLDDAAEDVEREMDALLERVEEPDED
jgi:hypothetical protein